MAGGTVTEPRTMESMDSAHRAMIAKGQKPARFDLAPADYERVLAWYGPGGLPAEGITFRGLPVCEAPGATESRLLNEEEATS